MAIVWDETGKRYYETGVDHAVLFVRKDDGSYNSGVPWNGITSISESPDGAEPNDLWADNMKYATLYSTETLGATIEAYTYPEVFAQCDGSYVPVDGVYFGQQNRRAFALSYRTKVGNDTGLDAYKIHIIYNCKASPSEKSYETINDSPDAITLSWEITTTPERFGDLNPVTSIIIDSSKLDEDGIKKLKDLENRLYGDEMYDSHLPSADDIANMFALYSKDGGVLAIPAKASGKASNTKVSLEYTQEGSDDASFDNIRDISGVDGDIVIETSGDNVAFGKFSNEYEFTPSQTMTTNVSLKTGETYILEGCPEGGSDSTYWQSISYDNDGETITVNDTGSGAEFATPNLQCNCKTVTGDFISIDDAVNENAAKLKVSFEPVQDGEGDPSPTNVRAISGIDSITVIRARKNLLPTSEYIDMTRNNIAKVLNVELNAVLVGKSEPFTISGETIATQSDANAISINISYTDGTTVSNTIYRGEAYTSGEITGPWSISLTSGKTVSGVMMGGNTGSAKCTLKKLQLEKGSAATAYEAYDGNKYETEFPTEAGTVYSGTLDILAGTLTVDRVAVAISDLTWVYSSNNNRFESGSISNCLAPSTNGVVLDGLMCSAYKETYATRTTDANYDKRIGVSTGRKILIRDNEYTNSETWLEAVGDQTIIYPLSTPTTYTLTSTQIEMFAGNNVLSVDNGTMLLKYKADGEIPKTIDAELSINLLNTSGNDSLIFRPWLSLKDQRHTYTVTIPDTPGTVYGGTLDISTGELTVDKVLLELNTANMNNSEENTPGWTNSGIEDILESKTGDTVYENQIMNVGSVFGVDWSTNLLYLPNDVYGKTQNEMIELSQDVQIVLTLKEPVTYTVPSSNVEIYSGTNYIWVVPDSGIEVKYRPHKGSASESITKQQLLDLMYPEYLLASVRLGSASRMFDLGDQINTTWSDGTNTYDCPFDIVHFGPVVDQNGVKHNNAMYLQSTYVFPMTQFDSWNALYYCDSALPAGTYSFTFGDAYGGFAKNSVYHFTTTSQIPAGGQILLARKDNEFYDGSISSIPVEDMRIYTFNEQTDITPTEVLGLTEGDSGLNLGTLTNATRYETDAINNGSRIFYGYNRYSQSDIRQFMNSNADAGEWWTPQNNHDRPSKQLSTMRGFIAGVDPKFLGIISPMRVATLLNTQSDSLLGEYEYTNDLFSLPSVEQVYATFGNMPTGVEGPVFDYWKNLIGTEEPEETGTSDSLLRKKYSITSHSTVMVYRLRTASLSTSSSVYTVATNGAVRTYYAISSYGFSPYCVVY